MGGCDLDEAVGEWVEPTVQTGVKTRQSLIPLLNTISIDNVNSLKLNFFAVNHNQFSNVRLTRTSTSIVNFTKSALL